MGKVRKDSKGRVLKKGESFKKDRGLYCFSYTDPFGKRKCFYAKDLPELREKERQMEKDRLDGLDIYLMAKADINFVFDRYISSKSELKSTTYTNYKYMYDRFVRNGFGKRLIASVTYSDVKEFYLALIDNGMQINTLESIHSVIHPTFKTAVRDQIIRTNPASGVVGEIKKSMNKHSGIKHALTLEQERAFLKFLDDNEDVRRWRPLFTVMFGTGCRVGEVIGLRWQDINIEEKEISINHNVTYYPRAKDSYKCVFEVSTPKTEAGCRMIPMLDRVKDAFVEERELQRLSGIYCSAKVDDMEDFIFCNRFGNLHNPQAINRAIKRLVERHNTEEILTAKREKREPVILPKFSCHITRHTFCTRMCENEVNVKLIQTIMWHADIKTTLDIYAEITESKKKQMFSQLDGIDIM